jgi:hypothetical protein
MAVLVALLVVGGVVGWRALFSPLPEEEPEAGEPTPTCDPGLTAGDRVRTRDVTVSVFNAGTRSGLAGDTRRRLVARGFLPGDVGNAPGTLSDVGFVRVLAPRKDDPAARLVALQFGRGTLVAVTAEDLGPGVDVVVGDRFPGLVKAPRRITARADGSGC